jgi:type IV pilus assembly protein PilN
MLRINLLPIKAARKHDTAKQELLLFIVGALVVSVALYFYHGSKTDDVAKLKTKVATVTKEIEQLKQDVVRVEEFKKKASTLEEKIKVIRNLQSKRIGPARMLDEIAEIMTEQEKVWLTKLVEKGGSLTLEGGAIEHENISDFQLALERRAKLITNVRLTMVSATSKGKDKYLTWKMVCKATYRAG